MKLLLGFLFALLLPASSLAVCSCNKNIEGKTTNYCDGEISYDSEYGCAEAEILSLNEISARLLPYYCSLLCSNSNLKRMKLIVGQGECVQCLNIGTNELQAHQDRDQASVESSPEQRSHQAAPTQPSGPPSEQQTQPPGPPSEQLRESDRFRADEMVENRMKRWTKVVNVCPPCHPAPRCPTPPAITTQKPIRFVPHLPGHEKQSIELVRAEVEWECRPVGSRSFPMAPIVHGYWIAPSTSGSTVRPTTERASTEAHSTAVTTTVRPTIEEIMSTEAPLTAAAVRDETTSMETTTYGPTDPSVDGKLSVKMIEKANRDIQQLRIEIKTLWTVFWVICSISGVGIISLIGIIVKLIKDKKRAIGPSRGGYQLRRRSARV